jgi:hypothetical protein
VVWIARREIGAQDRGMLKTALGLAQSEADLL